MQFSRILDALPPPLRACVVGQLASWRSDGTWVNISNSIESETALADDSFLGLIQAFGERLTAGVDGRQAWLAACRQHKFRGAVVPARLNPEVVGRALAIGDYAAHVAASGALSTEDARQLLIDEAGKTLPPRKQRLLMAAPVGGRYLVWATFNRATPSQSPFVTLPATASGVRCALGLGGIPAGEILVLIAYRPTAGGVPIPLFRPTIADAEDYPYYRPWSDPDHFCGFTGPLEPNTDQLQPQPELIHGPLTGEGLVLPFQIATP